MMQQPDPGAADETGPDPLGRFRNWPGFFWATLAVNLLFVYGMLGHVADPQAGIWFKVLVWLPFNAIASAVYYMLAVKLAAVRGGAVFRVVCLGLIAANWGAMLLAGGQGTTP